MRPYRLEAELQTDSGGYRVRTVWRSHSVRIPGAWCVPSELSLQTGDCFRCPRAHRLEGDIHTGARCRVTRAHPLE